MKDAKQQASAGVSGGLTFEMTVARSSEGFTGSLTWRRCETELGDFGTAVRLEGSRMNHGSVSPPTHTTL